jgi:hypothetical protein
MDKISQYTRPQNSHKGQLLTTFSGRVYRDILSIFLIPQFCLFFLDTRRWIKSKSTIRSILTHHRQNPTEINHALC